MIYPYLHYKFSFVFMDFMRSVRVWPSILLSAKFSSTRLLLSERSLFLTLLEFDCCVHSLHVLK